VKDECKMSIGKATAYQINESLDDCVMDAKSVALPWLPNPLPFHGCQIQN
jgi:hypothetical protein